MIGLRKEVKELYQREASLLAEDLETRQAFTAT